MHSPHEFTVKSRSARHPDIGTNFVRGVVVRVSNCLNSVVPANHSYLDNAPQHAWFLSQVTMQVHIQNSFPLQVFKPIEPPKMDPLPLALPSEPSAPLRLARAYERPRPSPDCQPQLVEEYILETEKTSPHAGGGVFHIKLSILQRPSDQEFLGELYVDRDHVEGERNGAACRFSLGTLCYVRCLG